MPVLAASPVVVVVVVDFGCSRPFGILEVVSINKICCHPTGSLLWSQIFPSTSRWSMLFENRAWILCSSSRPVSNNWCCLVRFYCLHDQRDVNWKNNIWSAVLGQVETETRGKLFPAFHLFCCFRVQNPTAWIKSYKILSGNGVD